MISWQNAAAYNYIIDNNPRKKSNKNVLGYMAERLIN